MTHSDELAGYTTETLEKIISDRRKEEAIIEFNRRREQAQYYLDHLHCYLMTHPKHGRTSCSDQNPCNGSYSSDKQDGYAPRCTRCFLLNCQKENYFPADFEINLYVERLPVE